MLDRISELLQGFEVTNEMLLMSGLAMGVLVTVFGISSAMTGERAEFRRMQAAMPRRSATADFDLILGADNDPRGLLKAFVPSSKQERTSIARQMRQAGIQRRDAVIRYYFIRTLLGIAFPAMFLAYSLAPDTLLARYGVPRVFAGLNLLATIWIVTGLVFVGFYGPVIWLRSRIARRRRKIWESLPNALDLLQVSVEAGLGLDAAMVRVSHELATVAPEISEEFMMVELEIQAGKDRQRAFLDMADRTGLDEVASLANVVLQAAQFGSSVSSALNAYAEDMRSDRELRAQTKANRLPVQMSGVMALCMMPALLMICLSPMFIRWVRMFAQS